MAIEFQFYPSSNRVPGVYVEMDASEANTGVALQRSLLLGQKTDGGTAEPNKAFIATSKAQAQTMCGMGSMLASMAERYLRADQFGALYLLPLDDPPAGAPATGAVTIEGTAAANGTLNLYIAGQRVQCGVGLGDTPDLVAANLAAAIAFTPTVPVIAEADGETIDLTARHAGEAGNDIKLQMNYRGQLGGEADIPGLTVTITPMSGGTASPPLAEALANLSAAPFDFIGMPYSDSASLDAMRDFLSDADGRWSWEQMIYGGAFSARRGTLGEVTEFSLTRNDQHTAIMPFAPSCPDPVWTWVAEIMARCAASIRVDPGLPLQYIATTLLPPDIADQWDLGERNTLLYSGLSTTRVDQAGTVILERMATTYQRNAAGATDNSYLDVETLYGLMFVARDLANYLLTRYARKKLVGDTTPILYGSNCVNARMIKASTIMEYRALEAAGYVQDAATFARTVVVENAGNGLIKILAPVMLVNQLRQIAILLRFSKP